MTFNNKLRSVGPNAGSGVPELRRRARVTLPGKDFHSSLVKSAWMQRQRLTWDYEVLAC